MKSIKITIVLTLFMFIACAVQDNARLVELAKNDQSDRKEYNAEIEKNDAERLHEVNKIIQNGELRTSNDFFNAAIVLQHGSQPSDYKKANELAKKAVEIDANNRNAKILIAQSMDRYLLSINKPQIYGTQRKGIGELEYLRDIDTTQISDEERIKLGVQTLKENLDYFNKMHHKKESNILNYTPSDSLIRAYFPEKRADLIGTFEELLSKIKYPKAALENNISGKVLIQYTITAEGNTKNIMVIEGIGYGCDEEAKRIIQDAKFKNYLNQDTERRTRIPFEIQK